MDSGASESVAPAGAASNVPVVESPGSRSGATYEVANGQVIDNLGQKDCIVMARGGSAEQILSFQICEVHKPLLSVSKLLSVGKRVIFDDEWSYIEDKFTGERLTPRMASLNYIAGFDLSRILLGQVDSEHRHTCKTI